jgi:hypothetical protein
MTDISELGRMKRVSKWNWAVRGNIARPPMNENLYGLFEDTVNGGVPYVQEVRAVAIDENPQYYDLIKVEPRHYKMNNDTQRLIAWRLKYEK